MALFGRNVCENERIGSRWGGGTRRRSPLDPPLKIDTIILIYMRAYHVRHKLSMVGIQTIRSKVKISGFYCATRLPYEVETSSPMASIVCAARTPVTYAIAAAPLLVDGACHMIYL